MKKGNGFKVQNIIRAALLSLALISLPVQVSATSPSPSPSSQNTNNQTTNGNTNLDMQSAKRVGRREIYDYAELAKVGMDAETQKNIDKLANEYMDKIGIKQRDEAGNVLRDEKGNLIIKGGMATKDGIDECVEKAKAAIDAIVEKKSADLSPEESTAPSSTSDFIMVGGNWMTPNATHGQLVDIVLPIVNMSATNLSQVTVTPVISNTVNEWPFVIETSGYTQTIADLPGKGNGQNDMDRRRELTWTFRTRDDAMSGYYKLQFNVLYFNGTETENATLTTYVKVKGAAGSGNIETDGGATSTPRVIVTGFTTEPAEVHAGDTFKLSLHLKNTSQRTAVSNMLVTIQAPSEGLESDSNYAVFLPTTGSNSSYISSIGKGAETDLTIELTAKNDLAQKPYQIDVNMEYEDESYTSYTSSADISIPVHQDARFEIGKPEIMPADIQVKNEANVMFSIYNVGKITMHNVKVHFSEEYVSGGETFLGKIEPGATSNVDAMITGEKATEGEGDVKAIITYEDEAGNEKSFEKEIALNIMGPAMEEGMGEGMNEFSDEYMDDFGDDYSEFEYEEGGSKTKYIVIGVVLVVIIIVIVAFILIRKRIKLKKEEKENQNLLSELEGEDDTDEIS